jgi:hypothetical protein
MAGNPSLIVNYLGDLQRLELKAGHVLVLKCRGPISDEAAVAMKEYLRRELDLDKYDVKCLVLGGGLELGVLALNYELQAQTL